MAGFDALAFSSSFAWDALNEEERYNVWSQHLQVGGEPLGYVEFCDRLDSLTAQVSALSE